MSAALLKTRSRRLGKPEGRVRCKTHLRWVAGQPCCVCGRRDVQVHHLTCGPEAKARGLKAGDDQTVPLCILHHDPNSAISLHHAGDERAWWARFRLNPIAIAAEMWRASRAGTDLLGQQR